MPTSSLLPPRRGGPSVSLFQGVTQTIHLFISATRRLPGKDDPLPLAREERLKAICRRPQSRALLVLELEFCAHGLHALSVSCQEVRPPPGPKGNTQTGYFDYRDLRQGGTDPTLAK